MPIRVAIILLNYKDYAARFLSDCIESIRRLEFPSGSFKVYIVDNESTPMTEAYISRIAPEADIIINKDNCGFAEGNNTGVEAAMRDGCDFVYFLNMDTVADPHCLEKVWQTYKTDEKNGTVQSRLMLHQEPEKINSLGNLLHFLGFGYCDHYKERLTGAEIDHEITYSSGAALFMSVDDFMTLGGFNPEFFMYHDDVDLGLKVRLRGLKNMLSVDSVVYHKYEFSRSISKFYWMERNRLITWLVTFKIKTLVLIAPAAVIMELGLMVYALSGHWMNEKIKAYAWFASISNWKKIMVWRRESQQLRRVSDRKLLSGFVGRVMYQEELKQPVAQMIGNLFFSAYWFLARKIIFW
ncbi:TPA: hypothetical protein DF272_03085 [Candidatus Falkowbacteria bacterium]|nr:hypothetical protein [Candidatus Falkowbacteria bacterium]